ncbi:hypothetical protein KSP40_PGU018905 [Platanthera guangdongensis]|uniref:MORF/ORRM1/DAG-like MORF domain-containing protein n=1 Tax=Platanthera guangdongensis TaxID=2320717 RepID=A0ABR2MTJ6_9ASPA
MAMEILRPLTFAGVSVADPYLLFPRFLPEIRTSVSLIKPRRRPSHSYPRLSTCACSSSHSGSLLSQPPEVSTPSTTRWMVLMEKPPISASKSDIVDYYVESLARVVGSEREAQMCIYDASCESDFGFCCDIDEGSSQELSRIPGVVSVRPDNTPVAGKKDYSHPSPSPADHSKLDLFTPKFSSLGKNYEYWIVRMQKPGVETVTKAQMVDYYAQILEKVLRNKQDAQVSIYHISWQNDLGFCCRIDEKCAKELSDVPGVLTVRPDLSFESENKNYKVVSHSIIGVQIKLGRSGSNPKFYCPRPRRGLAFAKPRLGSALLSNRGHPRPVESRPGLVAWPNPTFLLG